MSDFPDRVKQPMASKAVMSGSKCSGESSTRSKDNPSKDVKCGDQAKLAQVLQAYMAKVHAQEVALDQDKLEVLELTETCARQAQNISQMQCEKERTIQEIGMARKYQEIVNAKIEIAAGLWKGIHNNYRTVESSCQFIAAQGNASQAHINDLIQKSAPLLSSHNEMLNVQVPNHIQCLKNAVREAKDQNEKMRAEKQKMEAIQRQHKNEKEILSDSLACQKASLSDLESQIASEKDVATNLCARVKSLTHEKLQQKEALTDQLKEWSQTENTLKANIDGIQTDIAAASAELKKLQDEWSQAKAREEKLQDEFQKTKENLDRLNKTLSEKGEQQKTFDLELSAKTEKNGILSKELEGIRKKIQEIKVDTSHQISELQEELSRESTAYSEEEESVLRKIKDLQDLLKNRTVEAEMVKTKLIQMQSELDHERESVKPILETRNYLKNQVISCDQDTENLRRQIESQMDILTVEREAVSSKEKLLMQSNAKHDEVIGKVQMHLASLVEKGNAASEEVKMLDTEVQNILLKIEVLQKDDELSHTMMIEKYEKHISELNVIISILDEDIKDLAQNAKSHTCEIQQNIVQMCDALSSKENELANLKVTIASHEGERQRLAKTSQELSVTKQEKLMAVKELSEKVSYLTKEFESKTGRVQELQSRMDIKAPHIEEADSQIHELTLKFKNAQAEFSKLVAENDSAKQAFVRDHVKFQKTCEYRQDEIKALQKHICAWNEKQEQIQCKLNSLKSEAVTSEQETVESERYLKEVKSAEESLKAQVSQAEKEAKILEKQYLNVLKKNGELNEKIKKHREAKQRAETKGHFKVPMQGAPRIITPQSDASNKKEDMLLTVTQAILSSVPLASTSQQEKLTPTSILSTSSKPPTPQGKTVSFAQLDESLDDSQSSASTIILVPSLVEKLAANPGMLQHIITNQQRDRQAAKRRMNSAACGSREDEATPPKKRVSEYEISSSTPENESTHFFPN